VRITKYSHSCLRVEGDGVLVVDPGVFSERSALDGVDAVLVTHEHPDHIAVAAVVEAAQQRPGLHVYAHPDVLALLADFPGETVPVEPGQRFTAVGLNITAYGGQHAVIHPDIPRITNVAYLVDDGSTNFYHPGDSFQVPEGASVETLFAPLHAPWAKVSETIDFVRQVKPGRAFALHDALLKENGAGLYDNLLGNLGGTDYARLAPGTVLA
jgi:L-ascorbate metabolism protein UlaG (beta-lactamase superfamily)